jgi:hypothetical protein
MNLIQGVPAWHTAEEMQLFSNVAHSIEGVIVVAAGMIALAQAFGRMKSGSRRGAWPMLAMLVLSAGLFLFLYLLVPWHGLAMADDQWAFIFSDPQQRQHFLIAVLLTVGGISELNARRGLFPLMLIGLGVVFLVHQQHGESAAVARAVLVHQCLGVLFVIAGLASLVSEVKPKARWAAITWPVALVLAGLLLLMYREPAGAYHHESVKKPIPRVRSSSP